MLNDLLTVLMQVDPRGAERLAIETGPTMMAANLQDFILFFAISLAAASVALALAGRFVPAALGAMGPVRFRPLRPVFADVPRRYEFREGYLLSPLDPDDAFLDADIDRSRALDALEVNLAALSPELPERLTALRSRGEAFLIDGCFGSDPMSISGRQDDDRMILTVGPAAPGCGREAVDSATLQALKGEAEGLRAILDAGPVLMWKMSPDGTIQWANAPYLELVEQASGRSAVSWPVPDLFAADLSVDRDQGDATRTKLSMPGEDTPLHFEVSQHRQADGARLCAAVPIGPLVRAETALQSFIQTLSQTFAHLPIGLAVFDKRRELVMFNPAMATVSGLDVPYLSNRPSLVDFLDGLHERQRIPEPKNYRNWRDEFARLEKGAVEGSYHELWTLPDGDTLRVIGRPHPDGAVAFMFEDISSEVSLTRKFRGDLDLYHSVLDAMPGALAVFGHDGVMELSNAAYGELWGQEGDDVPMVETLSDAEAMWKSKTRSTKVWSDLRAFAAHARPRVPWSAAVTLKDGTRVTCHVSALRGGATLVRFVPVEAPALIDGSDGAKKPKRTRRLPMSAVEAAEVQVPFVSRRDGLIMRD